MPLFGYSGNGFADVSFIRYIARAETFSAKQYRFFKKVTSPEGLLHMVGGYVKSSMAYPT